MTIPLPFMASPDVPSKRGIVLSVDDTGPDIPLFTKVISSVSTISSSSPHVHSHEVLEFIDPSSTYTKTPVTLDPVLKVAVLSGTPVSCTIYKPFSIAEV